MQISLKTLTFQKSRVGYPLKSLRPAKTSRSNEPPKMITWFRTENFPAIKILADQHQSFADLFTSIRICLCFSHFMRGTTYITIHMTFILDDSAQWPQSSSAVFNINPSLSQLTMECFRLLIPLFLLFSRSHSKAIWSSTPAAWDDIIRQAYPIGNGRLGS